MPEPATNTVAGAPPGPPPPPNGKDGLEKQIWYHGFRPRKDVSNLLREPGDFLVRATDARHMPEIVISVLNEKREMINLTIKFENTKWQLGVLKKTAKVPRFSTIAELVEHYKEHRMPGHARLKHAIPRPAWLIKHDLVVYDKQKDLLGSGNFCHVFKGTYQRTPDEKIAVAVKLCHEGHASDKEFEETKDARNQMMSEAHLMSYYVHDHVIQLFGVACDHPPVLIVMEYCPGGNLEHHLVKNGSKIEIGERVVYAMESARGMRYLHTNNCVHRDLASRNCLISAKGQIKIADFGLSALVGDLEKKDEEGTKSDEPSPQIPVRWMAPETLRKPMKFSLKSDVWSFGVLLYEIFNDGEKPWPDDPPKKIATMIRKCIMPGMPEKTPPEIKELCSQQIWVLDREKRPTFRKICSTLWLASKKYKPPAAGKFVINCIPGVVRGPGTVSEETAEIDEDTDTQQKGHSTDVDQTQTVMKPPSRDLSADDNSGTRKSSGARTRRESHNRKS